jgi:hypothetical protein
MIGSFDESNVVFALLPKVESTFRTSDANTGFANLYNGPKGGGITATMANMGTGYGFRATEKDYRFDGVNDIINTSHEFTMTNTQKTLFTIMFKTEVVGVADSLFGYYIDANNYFFVRSGTNNAVLIVYRFGGATAQTVGSTQAFLTENTLHKFTLYIDGTTVKYKVDNGSVTTGTSIVATGLPVAFTDFNLAHYLTNPSSGGLTGSLDAFILGSGEYSNADIDSIHNLGPDLGGLVATDNGDGTMSLAVPSVEDGTNYHKSKYFPFANSFASWSKRKRNKR